MRLEKFAAIDIGSNAIRMLIANVMLGDATPPKFHKNSMVRVPIRLGEDSFTVGDISSKNLKRMIHAFKAFKRIMKVHGVTQYRAYATCTITALTAADVADAIAYMTEAPPHVTLADVTLLPTDQASAYVINRRS